MITSVPVAITMQTDDILNIASVDVDAGQTIVIEALNFLIGYPTAATIEYSVNGVAWNGAGNLNPNNIAVASFKPVASGRVGIRFRNSGSDTFTIPENCVFRVSVA